MIEIFDPNTDKYIYAILIFSFFQFFRVFFRKISYKIVQKTSTKFDDEILESIEKPVDYLFIIIGINIALSILTFDSVVEDIINKLLRSGLIVVIFWGALNVLTNLSGNIHKITDKLGDKFSAEVLNFIIKSIRFFIFIIGFIVILQEWGYNVSGFLASMGLVGMALALAAKDTAANLFGSLVIFIDKPFKVGDWIKTPQVEGTIENIGIRSTKVRTFAQAQVTVPNATIANSAIINWSRMGKRRIKMNIGITYDTPAHSIQNIIKEIKEMLENNDDIHDDVIMVNFSEFASSSLNIFCYYFTKTTNWSEFLKVREETYLEIMKIVERNGTSFAFPTQTLHIENNNELVE